MPQWESWRCTAREVRRRCLSGRQKKCSHRLHKMIQDGAGGGGAVAHGVVVEETDEHFVERGDYHFRRALLVQL